MLTHEQISQATDLSIEDIETAAAVLQRMVDVYGEPLGWVAKVVANGGVRVRIVPDMRTVQWRVRLRLYDPAQPATGAIVDSDEGLPPDSVGIGLVRGLPAAFDWAVSSIVGAHADDGHKLDAAELRKPLDSRLASLRVMLSRNGGMGKIVTSYLVNDKPYDMRLDLQRVPDPA